MEDAWKTRPRRESILINPIPSGILDQVVSAKIASANLYQCMYICARTFSRLLVSGK